MSESLQAISPINIDQDRRDFSSPSPIFEEAKVQSVKEKVLLTFCGLSLIYFSYEPNEEQRYLIKFIWD